MAQEGELKDQPPVPVKPPSARDTLRIVQFLHADTVETPGSQVENISDSLQALAAINQSGDADRQAQVLKFVTDAPGLDVVAVDKHLKRLQEGPVPPPEKTPRLDPEKGLQMDDREAFNRHKEFLIAMLSTLLTDNRTQMIAEIRRWNTQMVPKFPADEQPGHIMLTSQVDSLAKQLQGITIDDADIDNIAILAYNGAVEVHRPEPPAIEAEGEVPNLARTALEQHAAAEPTEEQVKPRKEPRNAVERRMVNIANMALLPALRNDVEPDALRKMVTHANELLTWVNSNVDYLVDADLLPAGVVDKIKAMPKAPPPQESPTS